MRFASRITLTSNDLSSQNPCRDGPRTFSIVNTNASGCKTSLPVPGSHTARQQLPTSLLGPTSGATTHLRRSSSLPSHHLRRAAKLGNASKKKCDSSVDCDIGVWSKCFAAESHKTDRVRNGVCPGCVELGAELGGTHNSRHTKIGLGSVDCICGLS